MTAGGQEFAAFAGGKYLSLETWRRNGIGVRTPVWFAAAAPAGDPTLYVYSTADSGKAKRIRRDPRARIAPCGPRGAVTGEWVAARATIVGPQEYRQAMMLLNRKSWPWKQLLDLFARFRPGHARVVIAIRPAVDGG